MPQRYRPYELPGCSQEAIENILVLLKQARFPVILAGLDVLWSKDRSYLQLLAEALEVPVATMLPSLGAFPYSHPLGVGIIGRGRGEAGNTAMQQADLVLALGVKFDYQTTRYNYNTISKESKIIQVCTDAEEVGRIYPLEIGLVCDAGAVMKALLQRVKADGVRFGLGDEIQSIKKKADVVLEQEANPNAIPLQPQAIARELRRVLSKEATVVVDGGNFAKHVRRHFEIRDVDTFYYPDDYGSVGASFPMALGAKAGCPEKPVVCLNGDGAFLLNSQELETAVREKLNIVVIVFNDYGFGNVRAYQKAKFNQRYMCNHTNPPYDEMARLFGADGVKVEHLKDLAGAVQQGLESDKPYVIDVMMSGEELGKPGFLDARP
jgi:acetolactate synthase-1/2/3 large subunit/sulfoacetaldehyde acetyltransferase